MASSDLFNQELSVIVLGLNEFFLALCEQNVTVSKVNWVPGEVLEDDIMDLMQNLL